MEASLKGEGEAEGTARARRAAAVCASVGDGVWPPLAAVPAARAAAAAPAAEARGDGGGRSRMEERQLAESGAKGGDMSMALMSFTSMGGECCGWDGIWCCCCWCCCRCWCGLRRRLAAYGPNGCVARTGPVRGIVVTINIRITKSKEKDFN